MKPYNHLIYKGIFGTMEATSGVPSRSKIKWLDGLTVHKGPLKRNGFFGRGSYQLEHQMGLYNLTNIPRAQAGEIHSRGEGQEVVIYAVDNGRAHDDPFGRTNMATIFIGDHMMQDPAALRNMYGQDIV